MDKQLFADSVATEQRNRSAQYLLPGNITPHSWYKKFRDENDKPDLLAITIFSDVFAWCRNGTNEYYGDYAPKFDGTSLSVSYDYFQEKFGFNKERVRRAFVRLENLGVLKRTIHNIELSSGFRTNRLFITIDQQFYNSCFRDSDLDIRVGGANIYKPSFIENNPLIDSSIIDFIKVDSKELRFACTSIPSPHQCGDLISNKNVIKNRSKKSNFCKNFLVKKEEEMDRGKNNFNPAPLQLKAPVLQLKDFYPLSKSDADHLQIKSGRDFSLNAMNEILLDMSKRVKNRWFKSKKSFLNYMGIAFKNEMRDAVQVSGENFKIRANETKEERTIQKQEEFLSQVEYSLQVSPEWHLKKKLCSVLEREKAYNLLNAYKNSQRVGGIFKIHLTKHVNLTERDKDIILNQVKATHESADFESGIITEISSLEIDMPMFIAKEESISKEEQQWRRSLKDFGLELERKGIWGRIREALIDYYGKEGEALDRSWFSKLESEIDEKTKIIKLKAPTEFIKDWIDRNYGQILEGCSRKHEYSYVIC